MTRLAQRGENGTVRGAALVDERRKLARSFGLRQFHLHAMGGQLLLDGAAPSHEATRLAGAAAVVVAGRLQVVNRLRVMPPDRPRRRGAVRVAVVPARRGKEPTRGGRRAAGKAYSGTKSAA